MNITSSSYLSTATYSCNEGYILVGQENRTCHYSGIWSGSSPSCLRSKHVILNTHFNVFCSTYCCVNLTNILLYEFNPRCMFRSIPPNKKLKKGHHMNQHPMGKIFKKGHF